MEKFKVNPHILDIPYCTCSEIVNIVCLHTVLRNGTGSAIAFTLFSVSYQSYVTDEEYTFLPSL